MELLPDIQKAMDEHSFTRDLPLHERIMLARMAAREHFEPGEYLQRTGSTSQKLHLILRGSAAVELPLPDGRVDRVMNLAGGDVAGWSWMVEPYQAAFDVRALEPVDALALEGQRLRDALEDDSYLGYQVLKRLLGVVNRRLLSTRVQLLEQGRREAGPAS